MQEHVDVALYIPATLSNIPILFVCVINSVAQRLGSSSCNNSASISLFSRSSKDSRMDVDDALGRSETILDYDFRSRDTLLRALTAANCTGVGDGRTHFENNKRLAALGEVVLKLILIEDWLASNQNMGTSPLEVMSSGLNEVQEPYKTCRSGRSRIKLYLPLRSRVESTPASCAVSASDT
jgi:hypothetical protein